MLKVIKTVATGLAVSLFALSTIAMADDAAKNNDMTKNSKSKNWMCETNASSSSNASDQKADDSMKKEHKSAKDAFMFAMKHCRDCTKITCTLENP